MDIWTKNDLFIFEHLIDEDPVLTKALENRKNSGLPGMEVSVAQGKFLYLLAKIKNAKRILELGTFIGYSTIWLAKALPEGGVLVSLEYIESHANTARKNIETAGLSDKVTILVGDAAKTLNKLIDANEEPFDMIFIDADKLNYPTYLELALQLSKPGTVIYGDNVIRDGELCNLDNHNPDIKGVRRFLHDTKKSKRVTATALQTVGIKGYDGFSLGVVE